MAAASARAPLSASSLSAVGRNTSASSGCTLSRESATRSAEACRTWSVVGREMRSNLHPTSRSMKAQGAELRVGVHEDGAPALAGAPRAARPVHEGLGVVRNLIVDHLHSASPTEQGTELGRVTSHTGTL